MIQYIAGKIGSRLIDGQVILEEDQELYVYGIEQGIHMILCNVMVFILGGLFQQFWQAIIFTVFFMTLRKVVGGYHAETRKGCYIFSFFMCFVALCFIKYGIINNAIRLSILLISGGCVLFLAPVEAENKSLNLLETSMYKKKSRVIWACEILLFFIACFFRMHMVEKSILSALALVSILLILGRLKVGFK